MFAAIRDNQAMLLGEKAKSVIRKIGRKGAISAQANRLHFVVLYDDGTVRSYRTQTGGDNGKIGRNGATNIDLHGDYVLISYDDGRLDQYNLRRRTHASKGNPMDRVKERVMRKMRNKK